MFGKDGFHRAEVARTKYKMSKFHLNTLGDADGAAKLQQEAHELYKSLMAETGRTILEGIPKDAEFDDLVFYWSR